MSTNELKEYQRKKLAYCIVDAYRNVPYYHEILLKSGVIGKDERINWDNYARIPKLTKNDIKVNADKLKSRDNHIKGVYTNHSGGSTGVPIEIWQDRELRLWGSEHDLLEGKESISLRIRNKIYGRKELNSFKISEEAMQRYVEIWNKYEPQWVEAYVQAIYEFALFIQKNACPVYTPKGIVTSAGTLYPSMRKKMEEVFQCKVFDCYGSREVGGIVCYCETEDELHLSVWNHYVEVLDEDMQSVQEGEAGKVYVTTLNNRVMPLIRYEIGDIAQGI